MSDQSDIRTLLQGVAELRGEFNASIADVQRQLVTVFEKQEDSRKELSEVKAFESSNRTSIARMEKSIEAMQKSMMAAVPSGKPEIQVREEENGVYKMLAYARKRPLMALLAAFIAFNMMVALPQIIIKSIADALAVKDQISQFVGPAKPQ